MQQDVRAAARAALAAVPINVGFVRAVLDGTAAGEVWCDRVHAPRAFHVVHPYGMSLVWGDAVDDAFAEVIAHLRARDAGEWLQVDPRWLELDWDQALGAVPFDTIDKASSAATARHTRVNFTFDADAFRARRTSLEPPEPWRARTATADDYAIAGSVVPAGFWPDAPSFLAHGGGAVLEDAGDVGAIAFASFRWDDNVEIGIETLPAFRRRSLGSAVAAAYVDTVVAAGLTPVWSCREDNVGSYRLAESVAFAPTARVPYYHVPVRR